MFKFMFSKKSPLIELLPEVRGRYLSNILLSRHTWLGVGGEAEVMYLPADVKDLCSFLRHKPPYIPICVIGGGSNLLVRDGGIPGVVIKLENDYFRQISINGCEVACGAGFHNANLKKHLLQHEIGGLEFLCSIPGVLGGSLKTNAGCFGREIKDVLRRVTIVNGQGKVMEIAAADFSLSYRSSCFPEDWIIVSLTMEGHPDSRENIEKTLSEHLSYRREHQPRGQKTAGSTFKNPEGLRAWELIKKSGCADLQIGGAKVSDKHCNFLINTGNATAKDIETLGETIRKKVRQTTSINLEWEVRRLGIDK